MQQVAVIGVGQTVFGKRTGLSARELVFESFVEAVQDAGVDPKAIESSIVCSGTHYDKQRSPAGVMTEYLGLNPKPTFHVEAACASSGVGLRAAWSLIQSGLHDLVVVIGFQKMSELESGEVQEIMGRSGDVMWESPFGPTMPGYYALYAKAHIAKYGTTEEQMAQVAVKSRRYGATNTKAMFQKEISVEDVLKSRTIASPLKLYDCCANADGAACLIVASDTLARKYSDAPVWIRGLGLASSPMMVTERTSYTSFECSVHAAGQAYDMARVKANDIDIAQVHDSFTSAEIIDYEDLGFCNPGAGGDFIDEGESLIGGKTPVNVDGGLLAKGHPVGATGASHIMTVVKQLRNEGGKTQVPNAKVGLAHNIGGIGMYSVVTILAS